MYTLKELRQLYHNVFTMHGRDEINAADMGNAYNREYC